VSVGVLSPPVIVARAGSLEGHYRLERRLGAGGMGEVWLGRHELSNGQAAVKVLSPRIASRNDAAALFAREKSAILRLAHPHIVPVFEVGPSHIAMMHVDGTSLARRLRSGVTPSLALRVVRQIASALHHAHAHGVLHLDVKPANILLDRAENAYLADFGTARIAGDGEVSATAAGTPAYIAPERASGEPFGAAADQFALGRTLVAALLGSERLPAWGEEAKALPPSIPDDLRAIVARATAVDPRDRFPDLAALERALAACDVARVKPYVDRLPAARDESLFGWASYPRATEAIAPEIACAHYTLESLEASRALAPALLARFRATTGLRTTGFSLFGHTQRLGTTADEWLARARHLIVLLHGYSFGRETWRDMAAALVRDNPDALVVTIDHTGFGESAYLRDPPAPEHLGYSAVARAALAWTELAGLEDVPTVFVGHSLAGSGLLSLPDDAFGPHRARIAMTPNFRRLAKPWWQRAMKTLFLRSIQLVARTRGIYETILGWLFRPNFQTMLLGPARRAEMLAEAKRLPVATHVAIGIATEHFDPPPAEGLVRTYFAIGVNDPEATPEACERAFRILRVRPERARWMASGYHYPHLDNVDDPAGTARNRYELVMLVDEALNEVDPLRTHSTDLAATELPEAPPLAG
jgi:hypothetical protein